MNEVTVEQQAKELGWAPLEDFRGDPERWVDAETFVEKGKHIMPILQKNNERLQAELAQVKAQQERQAQALQTAQNALEDLQEKHTAETQRAVDQARKDLKAQLRIASENGDHEGVAELTDQLALMPTKVETPKAPEPIPLPPDFIAWQNENKWFGTDVRRTALANAIGQELRSQGSSLIGKPFWDAVTSEVEKVFNPKPDQDRPGDDKVGSARNGSQGSNGRSYSDLPADAKQACDSDIRAKVGEGKRYKTAAEWRAKYAQLYFGSEG